MFSCLHGIVGLPDFCKKLWKTLSYMVRNRMVIKWVCSFDVLRKIEAETKVLIPATSFCALIMSYSLPPDITKKQSKSHIKRMRLTIQNKNNRLTFGHWATEKYR